MKYETPQLTALSALNAIQFVSYPNFKVRFMIYRDNSLHNDAVHSYADWED